MKNILRVIFLSGVIFSCSLFEVPETEAEKGAGYIKPPTEPINVIKNFVGSLNNLDIENYMNCFDTLFYFYPDKRDSMDEDPVYYRDFNYYVEDSVTTRLFLMVEESTGVIPPFQVSLSCIDTFLIKDTLYTAFSYTGCYEIKTALDSFPVVKGNIILWLWKKEEDNRWYIVLWIDERDSDTSGIPSWGRLKAFIRKTLF